MQLVPLHSIALTPNRGTTDGPRIVGVTGSIGGGKSTAASILESHHDARVIDADAIAGEVLSRPETLAAIGETFGDDVVAGGRLDRRKLASIVFRDPALLKQLESIVHPKVRLSIEAAITQSADRPLVVLDVPLLFEAGLADRCDETWYVDAPRARRIDRVAERGWTAEELQRRESNQWPIATKRAMADVIVDNGGDRAQLAALIRDALSHRLE